SGGQRQRVGLARALATRAPCLVLHDPTTAVDPVTEARIADGMRRIREGRATLLVTTSPALLARCDRVVLLEGGSVTPGGTHAALAAEEERYREVVLAWAPTGRSCRQRLRRRPAGHWRGSDAPIAASRRSRSSSSSPRRSSGSSGRRSSAASSTW